LADMLEKENEVDQSLEGKGSNIWILKRKLRVFQVNPSSVKFEGQFKIILLMYALFLNQTVCLIST
jgi:hypothetical protein